MYADRKQEAKRRIAMLEGDWTTYLIQHMGQQMAEGRIAQVGKLSLSVNLFRSVVHELATKYDEGVVIANEAVAEDDLRRLEGLFRFHQKLSQYVVGLREAAVTVSVADDGRDVVRVVTPDKLDVEVDPDSPLEPVYLREQRVREVEGKGKAIFFDVYDIRDRERPLFAVEDQSGNDVTAEFYDRRGYPWIHDGAPFIPFVIYHASPACTVFSPFELSELVDASLDMARNWNEWWVMMRDSSYQIRYMVDMAVKGAEGESDGRDGTRQVQVSHNTILNLSTTGEKPAIGVLASGVDLKETAEAIVIAANATLKNLGLEGVEITEAQSGVALHVRREKMRAQARKYDKQFEAGDGGFLQMALKVFASAGAALPMTGYEVSYPRAPRTPEEIRGAIDLYKGAIELGVITPEEVRAHLGDLIDAPVFV